MTLFSWLYDWGGANQSLFLALNGMRGPVVDGVMVSGTYLGSFWNALWVVGLGLLAATRWGLGPWLKGFLAGLTLVVTVVAAAKWGFDLPRPAVVLPGLVHLLVPPESPFSFPSGHSAFAMLLAGSLFPLLNPWGRGVAVAFVLWVGVSRVSVGAHFPADVVAGYLCGALGAVLAVRVFRRSGPRGLVLSPGDGLPSSSSRQ